MLQGQNGKEVEQLMSGMRGEIMESRLETMIKAKTKVGWDGVVSSNEYEGGVRVMEKEVIRGRKRKVNVWREG